MKKITYNQNPQKLQKATIFIVSFIFLIITYIGIVHQVSADGIGQDYKQIGGYIKFEGWDTVKDYIIVQPVRDYSKPSLGFNENNACKDEIRFVVINDSEVCNFGNGGHCTNYIPLAAIDTKYKSDIKFAGSDNIFGNEYSINCNSNAYKKAYVTDTEIPHMDEEIKKTDTLERKDYIVTFHGVNKANNKLLMSVSAPLMRYTNNMNDAKLFEASMFEDIFNHENNFFYLINEQNSVTAEPSQSIAPQSPSPVTKISKVISHVNTIEGGDNLSWKVMSYISVAMLFFITGLFINKMLVKKSSNIPSELPVEPK